MKARFGVAALLGSATLVWAAPAEAKELVAFKVCGAEGCTSVTDRTVLRSLIRSLEAQGVATRVSTPPPAPFLRLEYWVRGDLARGPSFVDYYIPSSGVAEVSRDPGSWYWVRPDTVNAVFRRLSKGVARFSAPRITRVTIGDKTVRDPASYVQLFALQGKADTFPDEPDWQRIAVRTAGPSPWSTSAATLEYSKSTDVLWRGSDFVKIDASIASRIEAREPLSGPAGRAFPWTLLFGGLGGAAVIVPAAVFFRRRRLH